MVTQDEQAPLAPRAWSCQPFATLMSMPINRLLVAAAAAVAVSDGLFAQPEIAATDTQLTEQRQQAIAELETEIQAIGAREGPNSAQLIDPLSSLGSIYQEAGEHLLATAAIERARHVVRVNAGLYSLEQAPLLRGLIQNADAL